jgi:dTDP-4-dehydrorhamnose 3,5-epimerase
MQISIQPTCLNDTIIVTPEVYEDERGFFTETFRRDQFMALGLPGEFVQFNCSGSVRNVTRGLHFQWDPPMGKLMGVASGEAFLVAVDIRKGSPMLGKWFGIALSETDHKMLWAPAGFARGFCVLSEYAQIQYLCTGIYNSRGESSVLWNDPAIGVNWPVDEPILSERDRNAQTLAQWLDTENSNFFTY